MPWNAIGSVIGSLIGGFSQNNAIDKQNEANAIENQKNRDFNARQATIAYQRQRAIIDANNEYESAKAQRQRLEEAGLNPYLMMDGGNAGSATSASVTPASSSGSIPMQARRYEFMQNMAMQAAQIANIKADTQKKEAEADLAGKQTAGQEIQNAYSSFNLQFDQKWREAVTKSNLNNQDADTLLKDANRFHVQFAAFNIATLTPFQAANLASDTAKKDLEAAGIKWNTEQSKNLYPLLVQKYGAEILNTKSQTWLNNQQGNFNNATFNARRNTINFGAGLAGYDMLNAGLDFGVNKVKKGAFHNNEALWVQNYKYYLEHLPGSPATWDGSIDNFFNRVASFVPGASPLNPIQQAYGTFKFD